MSKAALDGMNVSSYDGLVSEKPVVTVVALYLATVSVFSDMYVTQPILPRLARDFAVSPAVAGATISAVVLTIGLSSAFYGPLSEMLGRRRIMVWGTAALALVTLACGFATSFLVLLILRGLQGLLVPSVSALAVAYIYEDLDTAKPAALVGGYMASSVVGGLVSRVLGGVITDVYGWRTSFVCFSVFTLVGALALALTVRDISKPSERKGQHDLVALYAGMFRHLRDVRLVGAFVVGAALFFGFVGVFTYLPFYVTAKPFNLSTATISWLYVSYLAGAVVSPIAGRLAARVSHRTLIAFGLIVAIGGIALSLEPNLIAVVASTFVLCAGMFIAQPIAPTFVTATASGAKGSATALYQSFYYLGAVFGSLLPGFAWERWEWPGVVASCVAALVVGLVADVVLCGRRGPRAVEEPVFGV